MINSFKDKYRFLSNFYILENPIVWEGIKYPTNEHFYQAMKTENDFIRAKISLCSTPGKSKKEGNKVQLRNDWEEVKDTVMEIGLWLKFLSNRRLLKRLLLTKTKELTEGNYWHDNY